MITYVYNLYWLKDTDEFWENNFYDKGKMVHLIQPNVDKCFVLSQATHWYIY